MIASLNGSVIDRSNTEVVVDVNGVGYEVSVPLSLACTIQLKQKIFLHTHFVVREDAQLLFGFIELDQRNLFRELIKIGGVGPKMALAILSTMNLSELVQLVRARDLVSLERIPGVGKKTAQRLLVELETRIDRWAQKLDMPQNEEGVSTMNSLGVKQDSSAALESLGYRLADAQKVIKQVYIDGMSTDELIRACLQALS